jgi:hypothetical protein
VVSKEELERKHYIQRRVDRALMFRALRRIRGIVDDMERKEARNRMLALAIALIGILLIIALTAALYSRHKPPPADQPPSLSSQPRPAVATTGRALYALPEPVSAAGSAFV